MVSRVFCLLVLGLLLVGVLPPPPPAVAAEPLIRLGASATVSELQPGGFFLVVVTVHSGSETPIPVVVVPGAASLGLSSSLATGGGSVWSGNVSYSTPASFYYRVDIDPRTAADGTLRSASYTVYCAGGVVCQASAKATVRVGTVRWPAPRPANVIYMPLIRR